jgi:dTDP-4-dehydrorhamnose reductase
MGHEVKALDRAGLDITDLKAVSHVVEGFRPDYVINCAAYNDVDGAEKRPREALMVNGIGVRRLANAASRVGAVLVHFSTDFVFDGQSTVPYTIADSPNPISNYGVSKLLGEQEAAKHAERFFLIRTSWVFGRGKRSFPDKLIAWAREKDTLKMTTDQATSPTYAPDLAAAVMKLIETGSYGLYHITGSGWASRYEWAEYILKAIGWKGRLERAVLADFNPPAKRPHFSALDNFPLKETTGDVLPPWQDAVDRYLREIG